MLNVKTTFHAAGDGIADDTPAIQAALTQAATTGGGTVYFPPGDYRTINNLFVYETVSLFGEAGATLILDAIPDQLYAGFYGWINLGIQSIAPAGPNQPPKPITWSGRISGLHFTVTAKVNKAPGTATLVILVCHNCTEFCIENNVFALVSFPTTQQAPIAIECPGYPPPSSRTHGMIRGNWIVGNQLLSSRGGTEGMGLGFADYITFENNDIRGMGDDILACHRICHLVVRNNFCSGVAGNILITNCTEFLVEGNYVEHAQAADGSWNSGSLIRCTLEFNGPVPPCSGGRIVSNELYLPAGLNGAQGQSVMLRLEGVRRTVVANNVFRCETQNVADPAFSVEAVDSRSKAYGIPNWTDTEGIEPTQTDATGMQYCIARPRWLSIHGNRSVGNVDIAMGEISDYDDTAGPISWRDNDASKFSSYGPASSFSISNRVYRGFASTLNLQGVLAPAIPGGDPDGLTGVSGQVVPDALLLWCGSVTVRDTAASLSATSASGYLIVKRAGVTRFFPQRSGIVFYIKVSLSDLLSNGTIRIHLVKNGGFAAVRITEAEWQATYPTLTWGYGGATYVIVNFDDLVMSPGDAQSKRRIYWADARVNPLVAFANNSASGYNNRFAPKDYLEAWIEATDVSPAPLSALVEFYGMYTDNGSDGPSPTSNSIVARIGPL